MLLRLVPILLIHYAQSQNLGEDCKLSGGQNGICKTIADCPSAISMLQKRIQPERCGFQGNDPIVCCGVVQSLKPGAKSKQYCNETYIGSNNGLLPGSAPVYAVVHGVDSLAKEFPHMAALGFGPENEKIWACGGSLISKEFVLTAAHCLKTTSLGDVSFVRLGDLNIRKTDDDALPQDFKVIKTFRHPDYKPPSQYHDIALLQLDRPVEITAYVKPACLNTEHQIGEGAFTATGWGKVQFGGESSDHLQKVEIDIISNSQCRKAYANIQARRLANGIVDELQMCAGRGNKDTCQGDSGGPLQQKNVYFFEGYTVYGVTSIGKACGLTNSPGVYTRVSNYINWIESIVFP